ncbi:MAG: hypothetical protein ABI813_12080 [Bacteroidota bacterium]
MKMKTLRTIGLLCLLCIAVIGVVVYWQYNKPHRSAADETAVIISAALLAQDYEKNETVSNKKYLGHVLQVSGAVSEILLNQQHQSVVILFGSAMSGVQCTLLAVTPALKKGDTITIRGFCSGYLSDVIMDRCITVP